MITIKIKTENAAFEFCADREIADVLTALAERLRRGECSDEQKLFDVNGNTIGTYTNK